MTPRVTVLMCVYNGEPYLREAIDSVLAQTFRDFELLVVDDGSHDATAEILASYGDPRLRIVRNETNLGLTPSLNIGLRVAHGELVARQDADDRSHPSRLERQVRFLDANPGVVLVGTNQRTINQRGRVMPRALTWPTCATAAGIRWQLMFGSPFAHSSVMFRRAVIVDELGGYDEYFASAEDYELWSRVGRRHAMINLLEPLLDIRSHGASITAQVPTLSKLELVRTALRTNLIATLGDGDYERWLDFWMSANGPAASGRILDAGKGMSDLAALRARFNQRYPEAANEPEIARATGAALAILSCAVARHDRLAAIRIYAGAVRACAPLALQLLPRVAASLALGPLLSRRRRRSALGQSSPGRIAFVDPRAVAGLPERARDVLRDLYFHEQAFRARILASGSTQRASLMRQMYQGTWALLSDYDETVGARPYQSGIADRTRDVAGLHALLPPGRAIELGAGGGSLCAALARAGWTVDGTDVVAAPDWESIGRELGVRFHEGDLSDLQLNAGSYDLCIMDNVLEHFPPGAYESALRDAFSLLRPGGWFVAVVPNRLVGPHDVSRYFVERGRAADASHFNERRFSELAADLMSCGFRRISTVAYAGIPAGRRLGWSRLWTWKALAAEAALSALPPSWRHPILFACLVPPVIAAQKPVA